MHHAESRRVWMEEDTDADVNADIPVELETDTDQSARDRGVSFEDIASEVAAVPSDLDPPKPPPKPKHAMVPPPLPQDHVKIEAEPAPDSVLTPPSTRDLSTVTADETFTFPPPTIQSVAPLAVDTISERPIAPSRPKGSYIVGGTALMAVIIIGMFASWGSLTAPNTKAWSDNWKPPAPAAAAAPIPAEPSQPQYFSLEPVEVFTPSTSPAPATTTTAAKKAARAMVGGEQQFTSRRTMRTNARMALEEVVQPAIASCREGGMAPFTARITATFGPEGNVIDVQVDVPSAATSVGGCLAVAARRARIDAFDGEPLQVTRAIKVQ